MNGNRIFIDTNIIIYILSWNKNYIDKVLDKEIFVSFISELEVLSYVFNSKQDEDMAKEFFEEIHIIDMNENIKNVVITIKKKYKIKLPDCIILATCLLNSLDLLTNDTDLLTIYNTILSDKDILK